MSGIRVDDPLSGQRFLERLSVDTEKKIAIMQTGLLRHAALDDLSDQ